MLPPDLLQHLFAAAIASAQPAQCVPPYLPRPEEVKGRLVVLGAGKASAAMAQVVEQHWPGLLSGLVVTRYGYQVPCQRIEVVQAAHPVPDAAGLHAAQRMLALAEGLTADDVVLALISGGGSALLPLPLPGITLQDKQAINRALLASGASIGEMNTVRRHLSAIKGGRLAAACHPARVITLLLSDVPGDHPADIASGPTVGDASTCADALAIVQRYGLQLPPQVLAALESGAGESIKPNDPRLATARTRCCRARPSRPSRWTGWCLAMPTWSAWTTCAGGRWRCATAWRSTRAAARIWSATTLCAAGARSMRLPRVPCGTCARRR